MFGRTSGVSSAYQNKEKCPYKYISRKLVPAEYNW